jgi:hypothetical protein
VKKVDAREIVMKEFNGSRNFVTPNVEGYGKISENIAFELSKGKGIFDERQTIFGVSVVVYFPSTNKTCRFITETVDGVKISAMFYSKKEALEHTEYLASIGEERLLEALK